MLDLDAATPMGGRKFTAIALVIALAIFAGVAPTLSWLEFSSGSENLVVGTVLEMRRGGPWFVPELNGQPRTSKPPLVAWISASLVTPASVSALSDPAQRESAYRMLAWQIRWPALMFSCLALVAAAWTGRILFDRKTGLTAAALMGSTVMFLRFGRSMTTDVQLMLWVTAANACFAVAVLRGRRCLGCILGGVALGLALMSKGPVAFAQTLAPVIVLFAWQWWKKKPSENRIGPWPLLVALLIALLIALPWPIVVLSRMSGELTHWYNEMTHGGTVDTYEADPPTVYFALIPLLLPWAAFFFLGCVLLWREKSERAVLTLSLVIAPIVIMMLFREKNDRYLLPMLAPSAVISAVGLLRRGADVDGARAVVAKLTWIILLLIGIGLPVAGATFKRMDDQPWWPLWSAIVMAACCGSFIAWNWWRSAGGTKWLVPAGVALMIWSQALFTYGYKDSFRGRSDGKPVADVVCENLPADAQVWSYTVPKRFSRVPIDIDIYLNRLTPAAAVPTTLPTSGPPQAMLVHFRGEEKLPAGMEQWRLLGTTDKNAGTWRAYAQPREQNH